MVQLYYLVPGCILSMFKFIFDDWLTNGDAAWKKDPKEAFFNPVTLYTEEARRVNALLKCLATEEVRCLLSSHRLCLKCIFFNWSRLVCSGE